jgi:hypothetical protein
VRLRARAVAIMLIMAVSGMAEGCRSTEERPAGGVVVDPTVAAQVRHGPSRVLVEVHVPGGFKPEGELSPAAAAAQRQAITAAQQRVLSGLAGTGFRLARSFAGVPFLALEIDAGALGALRAMPDVVRRVAADELSAPSRP